MAIQVLTLHKKIIVHILIFFPLISHALYCVLSLIAIHRASCVHHRQLLRELEESYNIYLSLHWAVLLLLFLEAPLTIKTVV